LTNVREHAALNRRHEDEGVKKTAYCVENGARKKDASSRPAIDEPLTSL
jgi:hypothetical protein